MKQASIQVEASRLLRTLQNERKKQEKLEKEVMEQSHLVKALKDDFLNQKKDEIYMFIGAQIVRKFKIDITTTNKRELRELLKKMNLPDEEANTVSHTDMGDLDTKEVAVIGSNTGSDIVDVNHRTETQIDIIDLDWSKSYEQMRAGNTVQSTVTGEG